MSITKVSRGLLNTGVSDSSDATAITIDSNLNVGIGITNPSDYYSEQLVVNAEEGEGGITIKNATNNTGYLMFADGTSGSDAYRGYIMYGHASDELRLYSSDFMSFYTAGASRARIDADGLKFGSDSAAANALDDYEEGTFDAHFRDANNGNILVSATGNGQYTKIGRVVHVTIQVYQNGVSSTTLSSGYNYIEMPFTSNSTFNATTFLPMYYGGIGNIKAGYLSGNTNRLFLCTSRDNILTSLAGTETVGGYVRLYGDLTFIV